MERIDYLKELCAHYLAIAAVDIEEAKLSEEERTFVKTILQGIIEKEKTDLLDKAAYSLALTIFVIVADDDFPKYGFVKDASLKSRFKLAVKILGVLGEHYGQEEEYDSFFN